MVFELTQVNYSKIFCGYHLMHGKVKNPFHVKYSVAYIKTW